MNCNLFAVVVTLRNIRFWRVAVLLFIFPDFLFAQVFEAQTDTREVVLGSTFEISFSLKDVRGERFKAPEFSDFKIVGGPNEMRGMTIINGRSSSHQTWSYELEPRRTGTFSIGAASIVADGKTLTTKPVTIKVVAAKASPNVNLPPGSADNLFIVGEFDNNQAWLGQQVTWRVKLYTQVSLEGADIIELPDFEAFYSKEKRRFDTRVTYQTIRGKKYAVKTLHEEALFPQQTGDLSVGAAKVRVGIEQPGAFGTFFGSKPVVLQTQPVRLTVKPLPGPPPDNFTGGVGLYRWEVELDRDSLSTDDALTLKISLSGNGDSKRFGAPKLTVPAGLEIFEPRVVEEEEYENGEELIHSKVFEYVILPKEPGEYTLSPALSFFNPDTNLFQTLVADSLPVVRIVAGKNYQPEQLSQDSLPLPLPPPPTQFDWLEKISEQFQSPVLWSLLALVLALFGIFYFLKKRKNTTRNAPAPEREPTNRPAARNARERFGQAARLLNGGNPRAFYDELFKSLQGYLSARLNLTPAQMTQEQVRKILTERQVPSGTIQNLLTVWQTCEQALFAGQIQSAQMDGTWRLAESAVQDLEKIFGK